MYDFATGGGKCLCLRGGDRKRVYRLSWFGGKKSSLDLKKEGSVIVYLSDTRANCEETTNSENFNNASPADDDLDRNCYYS